MNEMTMATEKIDHSNIETQLISLDFDYDQLDEETKIFLQDCEDKIEVILKRSAYQIGKILIDVKQRLPHGKFGEWLEKRWGWSERTAQNMMNIALNFKSAKFADLFPKTAQIYLSVPSTPESARQEAIERAQAGENINHIQVKELIEAHKKITDQEKQIELLKDEIKTAKSRIPSMDVLIKIDNLEHKVDAKNFELKNLKEKFEAERQKKQQIVEVEKEVIKEVVREVVKIPEDYETLKNESATLTEKIRKLTEKFGKTKDESDFNNKQIQSLKKELEKKNNKLMQYDYKEREIQGVVHITEAQKLVTKASILFQDDRGNLSSISQTFYNCLNSLKNQIDALVDRSKQEQSIIEVEVMSCQTN